MDNEISKMFENANAYKMLCNCEFKNLYDYRIEYGSDVCDYTESKIKEPCKVCKKAKQKIKYYPDFTAEKQIELIKWLASKQYAKYTTSLLINIRDTVRFAGGLITGVCTLNVKYDKQDKEFENALAGVINEMWQDLTDQEKEEIRNILK